MDKRQREWARKQKQQAKAQRRTARAAERQKPVLEGTKAWTKRHDPAHVTKGRDVRRVWMNFQCFSAAAYLMVIWNCGVSQ